MKISVITAVFNGCATIKDTLDSVFEQTHPHVELIVIDGGSTDGTLGIVEGCRDRIAVLVSERDDGIYDALNKGLALATGDVVGFLHSDDVLARPDVLARIAAAFEEETVDAVYGDLVYVARTDMRKVIRRWRAGEFSPSRLSWGWMPPHPTFYARRQVYERWGRFDTRLRIAADYDCMLRVLSCGRVNPTYIPEVLVRMRMGGLSNRSVKNLFLKSLEDYRALRDNRIGGFGALAWKNISKINQFIPNVSLRKLNS